MPETILVIDDEPAIGIALTARLQASGYEVVVVEWGERGIEAARTHRPSAIILDVRLPDIDGPEVCRRLKADASVASIPVVFLSANAVPAVHDDALAAGGIAFVRKPYDATELMTIIRNAIDAASLPS